MIEVNDAPRTVVPVAEGGSAGNDYPLAHNDFEIILHPRDFADKVVCAWDGGKLRRRSLLEIGLAVVVQIGGTAIKVAHGRERNNVRIKTLAECSLIGAIEGVFTLGELLVQFQQGCF